MIWDLHTHLPATDDAGEGKGIDDLLRVADRMGVERLVTFMPRPFRLTPTAMELRQANDQVIRAVEAYPDRLFGLAYVSGQRIDASLQEMERCVTDGPLLGIKLWVARVCRDPEMAPIFEHAVDSGMMIFQHTWLKTVGQLPGESTPADLVEVAARFPHAPIICGHCGGNWQLGLRTVRTSANVWVETSGFDPEMGMIEMALREIGSARILFGSDVIGRSFASQIAKVRAADISEDDQRKILRDNLRALILPILKRKGMSL